MSFSFSAVGTKDEVIAQLASANMMTSEADHFNYIAPELRDLIVKYLEASTPSVSHGSEYRYRVTASGHSSDTGTPLSVSLTVEPIWVTVPVPA